jgi:hypothetical protein
MATLIKSIAGSVFVERIEGPQYMSVSGISIFSKGSVLLSSVTVSRRESLQHIKTMTNNVYTYAFGELPGQVQVGGVIIFLDACGGVAGSMSWPNDYYSRKRAYVGKSTYIGIGGAGFRAVLTGLDMAAEAGPFPHGRFTLGFTVIPRAGG